ncbi:MAG: Cas9 inhibitor AcrIIA9 family protein [Intestinimonas sp.]|jgi:hypothetical protein|nr:Cas9 inhibitor AcrIIA9 family protein [Intestinimonas sp.]
MDMGIEKAIEKINAEMQKDPDNTYLEIIGHYVIDRCADDVTAARVAADGKSLNQALAQVTEVARKAAHKNVAVLTPDAVFNTVDTYFEITRNDEIREKVMVAACGAVSTPVKPPVADKVMLDLEDFL